MLPNLKYTPIIFALTLSIFTSCSKEKPNDPDDGQDTITYVVLNFDDGRCTDYTRAFIWLKNTDFVNNDSIIGTLSIISSRLYGSSFLEISQLAEMRDYGWEICSHALDHTDLTLISLDSARFEIDSSLEALASMGFVNITGFVYPFGSFNDSIKAIVKKKFNYARGIKTNLIDKFADLYDIGITNSAGFSQPVDSIFEKINWNEIQNGDRLHILVFHKLVPDDTTSDSTSSDYRVSSFKRIVVALDSAGYRFITLGKAVQISGSLK